MVALNKAYCVCVNPDTFNKLLSCIEAYIEHKEELKKIKHEHISGRYVTFEKTIFSLIFGCEVGK